MKKFRIKKIKEAIEETFAIELDKINSRIENYTFTDKLWQPVIGQMLTAYYYEECESDDEIYFRGFINIGTNKIVVGGDTGGILKPADFSNTNEAVFALIAILSVAMKNRYKALMRERKINSILS